MNNLSVFGGTGYIGSTFLNMYPDNTLMLRGERCPVETKDILYLISTTTNQNIFQDLQIDIDTNLKVLTEVLSHCKRTDTVFNFVSSLFVYGNDFVDASEDDDCNPTGFYSVTKRCAEQLLITYCETFGIKYRIFRLSNVFGIDPTVSKNKNVLGYMIRRLKNNETIYLYDGGDYYKDYISVQDVCRAMSLLMEESDTNQIYNIGTGTSRSFREIIEYVRIKVKSKSDIQEVPIPWDQRCLQIKNATMNVEKLMSYGFVPELDIDAGVDMMCKVY